MIILKKRYYIIRIFLLVTTAILILTLSLFSAMSLSKVGSQGEEVRQIQTKLNELGYFNEKIDGIYGTKTKNAVINFQKDNNLNPDGIVGTKTLENLNIKNGSAPNTFTESEISLLARIISAESRGEPYEGQVAVGAVILNRIDHPSFPNTLAGVIYQPSAFTCVTDGQINENVADSAIAAAQDALNGWDPTGGAIYYYNPAKTTNKWIYSKTVITTIGKHKFCV